MIDDRLTRDYDVVVIGSGTSGMMASIRAHDRGLSAIVLEKSRFYGGTSARSGGNMWVPTNHLMGAEDSPDKAMAYMHSITRGTVAEDLLGAYLEHGPAMLRYLEDIGVPQKMIGTPDYAGTLPGAMTGRSTAPVAMDAALLGDELRHMRMPHPMWRVFGRYAMDQDDLGILGLRLPGWKRRAAQLALRYWLDVPWRLKTKRDRRLTFGNALIGGLRLAMMKRQIPLVRNVALTRLMTQDDVVHGAVVARNGNEAEVIARQAVVLAGGGFEHNPVLRAQYLSFAPGTASSWATDTNTGDALLAGQALGAGVEFMGEGFWVPGMTLPAEDGSGSDIYTAVFRNAHSLAVNRAGDRFVDEAASYDDFGNAMVADHDKTGQNLPCWYIFDAQYRAAYACGGLLPSLLMPDWRVPATWWDQYVYRANRPEELAAKIGLDPVKFVATLRRFNDQVARGHDPDFGRGDTEFDRVMGGDPRIGPNPSLGSVDKPPYYAVPVHLCDLGTKGGLTIDDKAGVVKPDGSRIPGLYAVGLSAASIFGAAYPGGGSSIGPANAFAFAAANDIADRQRRNAPVGDRLDV